MDFNQLKDRLAKNSPFKGEAEWVVVFVENGSAKAISSPSEVSAREVLRQHPEGGLYFGHVYLIEVIVYNARKVDEPGGQNAERQ